MTGRPVCLCFMVRRGWGVSISILHRRVMFYKLCFPNQVMGGGGKSHPKCRADLHCFLFCFQLQPFMGACLGNLRNLIIGGNSLEYLPQDVFVSFPNLDQLKLTMNGIEVMDKSAFSGLHKLTHLDLSENRLFSPNPDWFQDLESLEVLDLSHNNLHMLPREGFRFLTSLRILDLSFNQIQHVYPHAFHGLTGLKQLFLNSNHIPSVPFQSTRIFSSIELMDISNNHFKYLQAGDFHGLNVSHLKLNNNKNLLIIDKDTFVNLQLLEKLEVQNNEKLVYLDRRAFTGLKRLDTILLSGNGFTGLDPGSIPSLPTVKALSLGGNPWTCDCRLEWIDSVLSASQSDVTLVDKRTTSCAAPDTKMGCLIPAAANQEKCDKANGTASSQDIAENDNDPDTSLHPSSTQRPPLSQDVQSSKHSVTSQPSESSACKPAVVALFAKAIEPYIGEEIQLDCRARGQPEPEIEWIISTNKGTDTFHILKPGQSLSRDTRVSVLETGSLHIEYVNHYDIGNYTCKAVNVHGESAFTGSLTIKSVLSHIIVVRVTDTSVTVTWKTDIHVHGYQILYRVKAPNSTIYHKVDILPYMKYYTVSGLSPRTGYEICIAVKHGEKSLLISCNITGTKSIGYTKTAVHDATGYIVGGTTVCLCAFVVLMCIGSHAVRMYNRKRKYPLEGQTGEDSDMFLAGLDSLSETSPMTYENRFALMFDDSDIEEIQISAAEASASLGLRIDTDVWQNQQHLYFCHSLMDLSTPQFNLFVPQWNVCALIRHKCF